MFLYELALELDKKSVELIEIAEALGMGHLGAPSEITREQVAQLRAAVEGRVVPGMAFQAPGAQLGAVAPTAGEPAAYAMPTAPAAGMPPGPHDELPYEEPKGWRGSIIAIGAVVVAVVLLFAYMTMNAGPDAKTKERVEAAAEAEAQGQDVPVSDDDSLEPLPADDAEATEDAETTTTTTPRVAAPMSLDVLLGHLPDARDLSPVGLKIGIPGEWVDGEVTKEPVEESTGIECIQGHDSKGMVAEEYSMMVPTVGKFGDATVVFRVYEDEAQAKAWMAAHDAAYDACDQARSEATLVVSLGATITSSSTTPLAPAADGTASRWQASFTAGGESCTTYIDTYRNAVGPYTVSVKFHTCKEPLDPAGEQAAVAKVVADLTAATKPQPT